MSWAFDKPKHGGFLGKDASGFYFQELRKAISSDTDKDAREEEAGKVVSKNLADYTDPDKKADYQSIFDPLGEIDPFASPGVSKQTSSLDAVTSSGVSALWAPNGEGNFYDFGETGTGSGGAGLYESYDPTANKVVGSFAGLFLDLASGGHTNYAGGVFGAADIGEGGSPALASAAGGAMAGSIWGTASSYETASYGNESSGFGTGGGTAEYNWRGEKITGRTYDGMLIVESATGVDYAESWNGERYEIGANGQAIIPEVATAGGSSFFGGGMEGTIFGNPEASGGAGGDAFAMFGNAGRFYDLDGDGKPDNMAAFYGSGGSSDNGSWFFGASEKGDAKSGWWGSNTTSVAQEKDIWGRETGIQQQYASYGVNGDDPWKA